MKRTIIGTAAALLFTGGAVLFGHSAVFAAGHGRAGQIPLTVSAPTYHTEVADTGTDSGPNVQDQSGSQVNDGTPDGNADSGS